MGGWPTDAKVVQSSLRCASNPTGYANRLVLTCPSPRRLELGSTTFSYAPLTNMKYVLLLSRDQPPTYSRDPLKQDEYIYEPLAALVALRTLEIVWDIPVFSFSLRDHSRSDRMKCMVKTCFERCPSPDFKRVFLVAYFWTDPDGPSKRYAKRWMKGDDEGQNFYEWETLWKVDW